MTADPNKGHFRCYVPRSFNAVQELTIAQANDILDEYRAQGLTMTLRQLYYQFVARDLLPNTLPNYNRLGKLLSEARMAGLVAWDGLEDSTRKLRGIRTVTSPADAVQAARDGYARDLWEDQPFRPEVWVEKEALVGVISSICNELRVDFFSSRGYNSQSEQWRAGQRFARYVQKGQRPIVFHLGDHDPSGIDMTRDNQERLSLFAGTPVLVQRLALNMPQIERYNPPPNPAKLEDPRAADYIEKFGQSSWELDALRPDVIRDLIRSAVDKVRDEARWSAALARESDEKDTLDITIEELK
jgi:hypothetical protein